MGNYPKKPAQHSRAAAAARIRGARRRRRLLPRAAQMQIHENDK